MAVSLLVHTWRATNQGLTDGAQWLAWDSLGPFLDLGPLNLRTVIAWSGSVSSIHLVPRVLGKLNFGVCLSLVPVSPAFVRAVVPSCATDGSVPRV